MSVMDGLEATKQFVQMLGQPPRLLNTVIIAMTANVDLMDKKFCFDVGMNDLLVSTLLKWLNPELVLQIKPP